MQFKYFKELLHINFQWLEHVRSLFLLINKIFFICVPIFLGKNTTYKFNLIH
jgi:hypothetical protein